MSFPRIPRSQGLLSKTFNPPALDGSKTIPEIVDWHLVNNPEHPLFVYNQESTGQTKTILWKDGVRGIHNAASLLGSRLEALGLCVTADRAPVVGIFAASDTISYFLSELGLFRAGYVPFLISTRNSSAALAHLLSAASVEHLLVSGDPGTMHVVAQALAVVPGLDISSFVSDMPHVTDVLPEGENQSTLYAERNFKLESLVVYIHSSGSTGFPKVVKMTHQAILQSCFSSLLGAHDFCHQILGCQSIPMFHGLGLQTVMQALVCGTTLATFEPRQPMIPMTPDTVLNSAIQTKTSYLFVVPMFLEMWFRDSAKVAALAKMKGIMYGGGPLKKVVGDTLTEQGVNLYVTYGASETTMIAPVLPPAPGKDWEYFTINPTMQPQFVPCGDGQYELVLVSCDTHHPSVTNMKWNGRDAYATGDLLAPHPSKEGYWMVFGRADDQIMLSTGEKTNPLPLEAILAQDPHIQDSIMFGRGRFQNGVIIQPKPGHSFNPADSEKLASFRNQIWPTVEKLNEYASHHSRLFKESILVVVPDKPFTYTAKGTIQRQLTVAKYAREIEEMYEAITQATQEDIHLPSAWTREEVVTFVHQAVHNVMKTRVSDSDDLFQNGCDSLQATWIRNTIIRALKTTSTASVPNDLVYQHPSISELVTYCLSTTTTKKDVAVEVEVDKITDMRKMLLQFSCDFPPSQASTTGLLPTIEGKVVLLTGSTGGLGSHLLELLASHPSVHKIYALNRTGRVGTTVESRQRLAFTERGIDTQLLHGDKVVLLEGDLTKATLGLDEPIVAEIRRSVTTIIHTAYRVDFNLALSSFESSLGIVRNLVDFALSFETVQPPRIVFTSSVSVLRNGKQSPAPELIVSDPSVALGTGYSESKWVAEQILSAASAARPDLVTTSVRVGQLTGGPNGCWNTNEWFPSLVRSGPVLRKIPLLDEDISWLPMNAAAAALAEIALATSPPLVLNLAHPHPVSWSSIIKPIAHALDVPLVPYDEWLGTLEESLNDTSKSQAMLMHDNPALRLLSFFQGAKQATQQGDVDPHIGREAMNIPRMALTQMLKIAPSLNDVKPLDAKHVERWLAYWGM